MAFFLIVTGPYGSRSEHLLEVGKTYHVGRDEGADIVLDDLEWFISRDHLILEVDAKGIQATMAGTNGGQLLRKTATPEMLKTGDKTKLEPGDRLELPDWTLDIAWVKATDNDPAIDKSSNADPASAAPSPKTEPSLDLDCLYGDAPSTNPKPRVHIDDEAEVVKPSAIQPDKKSAPSDEKAAAAANAARLHSLINRVTSTQSKRASSVQLSHAHGPYSGQFIDHDISAAPQTENPRWRRGSVLFRVPRTMWVDTAELAELRLSPKDPLTVELYNALARTMIGRGETDVHSVQKIGKRMKAELHVNPDDMTVTSLSSGAQDLHDGAPLAWDWRLIPKREGRTLLTLRLTMLADLHGVEMTVDAQALHSTVDVTVHSALTRPKRFLRDNWRWMLGTSGIGAVASVWALFR